MSTIETGGPAFPMQEPQAIHAYAIAAVDGITNPDERDRAYLKARAEAVGGMTLRDYFAAKAIQGLACSDQTLWPSGADESDDPTDALFMARTAYMIADAMLKAREVKP